MKTIATSRIALEIFDKLTKRNHTLASAESCTGGMMALNLSSAPGSSEFFMGGIVVYTEQSKINVLGVSERTINNHGVVSEEVAFSMAVRARHKFAADWAMSTTGYSGPTGGTPLAPLGTLCVAISGPLGTQTRRYLLKNLQRRRHQEKSCNILLNWFLTILSRS